MKKWKFFISLLILSGFSCVSVTFESPSQISSFAVQQKNKILLVAQTDDLEMNQMIEESFQKILSSQGYKNLFLSTQIKDGQENQNLSQWTKTNGVEIVVTVAKRKNSILNKEGSSGFKPIVSYDSTKDCDIYLISILHSEKKQKISVEMVADFSWSLFSGKQDLADKLSQQFYLFLEESNQHQSIL